MISYFLMKYMGISRLLENGDLNPKAMNGHTDHREGDQGYKVDDTRGEIAEGARAFIVDKKFGENPDAMSGHPNKKLLLVAKEIVQAAKTCIQEARTALNQMKPNTYRPLFFMTKEDLREMGFSLETGTETRADFYEELMDLVCNELAQNIGTIDGLIPRVSVSPSGEGLEFNARLVSG